MCNEIKILKYSIHSIFVTAYKYISLKTRGIFVRNITFIITQKFSDYAHRYFSLLQFSGKKKVFNKFQCLCYSESLI